MAGFFSKIFGKKANSWDGSPEEIVQKALDGVIDHGDFSLNFEIAKNAEGFVINLVGKDSKLLTNKDGLVLDAFQTYLKRLMQNRYPDQRIEVKVDCDGFLEVSANELRQLADKLKDSVLKKGQPAFVRALPPRDRKVVHRHLAEDERLRSQSIGEGFCKKIKISLARNNNIDRSPGNQEQDLPTN